MSDAQRDILAWIGQLAVSGEMPSDKQQLVELLRGAGFGDAAIDRALEQTGQSQRGGPRTAEAPAVVQLSDQASRFLADLRDLGYLDDEMEDDVLDALMDPSELGKGGQPPHGTPPNVQIEDVRVQVAAVLFDRQYELEPDTLRFLEEEWRLAFH